MPKDHIVSRDLSHTASGARGGGAEHTPGPWRVEPSKMSRNRCIYASTYGIGEAWDLNGKPENAANAHLMAAAPDLLGALQALVTAVTYVTPPKDYGTPTDPNPCFEARVPVAFIDHARAAIAKALPPQPQSDEGK